MNLNEIFGTDTAIRVGTPTKTHSRSPIKARGYISGGAEGYASDNPVDPHLVAKRNRVARSLSRDGYYQWIKYVVDHNLAEDNIHAPRVYSIQLTPMATTDANQNFPMSHLYRIDIERLESYATVEPEELYACAERLLGDSKPAELLDLTHGSKLSDFRRADIMRNLFIIPIKRYFGGTSNEFKDEKMVEVLNAINSIKTGHMDDNGIYELFAYDTHEGNYMFRRTSVGVQLVAVDPLV